MEFGRSAIAWVVRSGFGFNPAPWIGRGEDEDIVREVETTEKRWGGGHEGEGGSMSGLKAGGHGTDAIRRGGWVLVAAAFV